MALKYKTVNTPLPNLEYLLGSGYIVIDNVIYPVSISKRPTTVTIYNTVVNTGDWTLIQGSLSGVFTWKLKDKEGQEFDYAFVAVPTTYMTSLGESLQRDTDITGVYVKRRTAVTLNMQLEVWTK